MQREPAVILEPFWWEKFGVVVDIHNKSGRQGDVMGEEFKKRLSSLLNEFSIENDSDTPDFMLAEYLVRCLENFGVTVKDRDTWTNA